MNPIGNIPTPYGTSIPVFRDPRESPDDDRAYFRDIDGCMTLAGVHGEKNRERCRAEIKQRMASGAVAFDIFLAHGGQKVPHIALKKPADPVYLRLPRDMALDIPIENWVTVALDHANWNTRADAMLGIIDDNLDVAKGFRLPPELPALALANMLTASVEHLVEPEIDCLEAAALYALTLHYSEWSAPAVEWLMPVRETWFRDWTVKRPAYARFATLMREINPELPAWIAARAP